MHPELHEHLDRLHKALRTEEDTQRREHERQAALSLGERIELGVSWPPVHAHGIGRWGRRIHVAFDAPKGQRLHDGISNGEPIEVNLSDGKTVRGIAVGLSSYGGELLLETDSFPDGDIVVTKRFDPTTFARFRMSLEKADSHRSLLRSVLLGERDPDPVWEAPAPACFEGLDDAQLKAARIALGSGQVALIHGPPGTGKTHVLTAILRALVGNGDTPWALAASNAAADHLAVSADSVGLNVVRLGHPTRMGTAAAALSLEQRMAKGPLAPALAALEKELAKNWDDRSMRRQLLAERDDLREKSRKHVIDNAQVLVSTFGTLAKMAPDLPKCKTAVVDEATQATEPAIWAAVPWVERLILAGDPNQLGPVVKEPNNPLEKSLLTRLLEEGNIPMPMLEVQRRMNSQIRELVAGVYGENYVDAEHVAGVTLANSGCAETDLTAHARLFIDTAGADLSEARDPVTQSLYNEGEIGILRLAMRDLREAGVESDDVGVIAPYSAQVARLAALPEFRDVEVATVNAFQGREKRVILCSFVRSNPNGELGFLADGRRLTVALTRAKQLLLLTGDSATLGGDKRFGDLFDRLSAGDAWRTVWEEPWSEVTM